MPGGVRGRGCEAPAYSIVRSAWHTCLGCKCPMGTVAGTISRTARAVTVRCSLKDAAGELPASRTGIVYEAALLDKRAHIFEVRKLFGNQRVIYGRHTQEGRCALPREICMAATGYGHQAMAGWACSNTSPATCPGDLSGRSVWRLSGK